MATDEPRPGETRLEMVLREIIERWRAGRESCTIDHLNDGAALGILAAHQQLFGAAPELLAACEMALHAMFAGATTDDRAAAAKVLLRAIRKAKES